MFDILDIPQTILYCGLIIACYQLAVIAQKKTLKVWLNPTLISIVVIISALNIMEIPYQDFYQYSQLLHWLLEPAIVALGFPLYQQIKAIKHELKIIIPLLTLAISAVIIVSILCSIYFIERNDIAVSLALKSITTPVGLALTKQLNGVESITAIAIIIAGLTGAIWGIKWLNLLGLKNAKAQGLAVGCASHVLGTATISHLGYQHAAYSALSLILSAIITAIISPVLIPFLFDITT
jgi:putative effector of murein hydrolase